MRLLVVTLAPTLKEEGSYYAYAPYVNEMDIWFKHAKHITIVCPTKYAQKLLKQKFKKEDLNISSIPFIKFTSLFGSLKSIFQIPFIVMVIFFEMRKADHIHLRCPGNIGLLGCFIQILFPSKSKTAKYAGNWDPKAKQPLSYRMQKWLLSNTFLTRNMKVLVYGKWEQQSKNIIPFFTATYTSTKVPIIIERKISTPFSFLFVGTLSQGKRPLYAIQFVAQLLQNGVDCSLKLYGEGTERTILENYIKERGLEAHIQLLGNQEAATIEKAYRESDFLLLPSKSEGWPKVVAEAMFWGTIPLVTAISCVPWMLDHGKRGLLLTLDLEVDITNFSNLVANTNVLQKMPVAGQEWSHEYTLDRFENKIKKMLQR